MKPPSPALDAQPFNFSYARLSWQADLFRKLSVRRFAKAYYKRQAGSDAAIRGFLFDLKLATTEDDFKLKCSSIFW